MIHIKSFSTKNFAWALIFTALSLGFVNRILSVFRYTTFDIGPAPDQIRDAYVYMNMLGGNLPSLGPASSVGGYSLPPLYYYLVFPVTILGADPALQVLPNAILSFLTIPALILLVYQLLENVDSERRLLLAGLSGLWYSLLFADVFLSTFEWNPTPIPFFLTSFCLLYKYQLELNTSLKIQALLWFFYGINLAILSSLHSTTLFVMPVVFVASVILFEFKKHKSTTTRLLPIVSFASAALTLLPYWAGEFSRGWSNTKKILSLLSSTSERADQSIWERLGRIVFNYLELGRQTYLIGGSWTWTISAALFLAAVLIIGIAKFRGNQSLLVLLITIWILYFYAASNYTGYYAVHYKLLILFSPIILTVSTLAYLDYSKKLSRILAAFVLVGLFISLWSNLYFNIIYLGSKYGSNRLISTSDLTEIIEQLPQNSTVCDPEYVSWRKKHHAISYIDSYITKKGISLTERCQRGNYVIYPKSRYIFFMKDNIWPALKVSTTRTFDKNSELYLETPVASVYRLNQDSTLDKCESFVGELYDSCTCSNIDFCWAAEHSDAEDL